MLNERLISNAWDLLQNGPAIVVSADEAGSLAGQPAADMGEVKRGLAKAVDVNEYAAVKKKKKNLNDKKMKEQRWKQ